MGSMPGNVVRSPKLVERRRRVRNERRRRRRRVTIGVFVGTALIAGALAVSSSSVFAITAITVEGTQMVDEAAVIEASGLSVGANALSTDLDAAAERVRALASIGDARIERAGLGVRIIVVERRPVIEVRGDGRRWLLDPAGVVIPTAPIRVDVPVVVLADAGPFTGQGSPLDPRLQQRLLRVWEGVATRDRRAVEELILRGDGSITFRWGRTTVAFGEPSGIRRKLRAMRAVEAHVRAAGGRLAALDVRSPRRPAARVG